MKLSLLGASAILAGSAVLFASCASTGGAPAPAAPQKVATTRTVAVKTPVLVKESSFYADGLLDEYTIYKYDDSKTRLLEKATYEASRPDPLERVVSEWKDGRLAVDTAFDADGKMKLRREYAYDAAGRLANERVLDAKAQPQSSSAYLYDGKGAKVEWRAFDGSGLLRAVTRYSPGRIDLLDAAGKAAGAIVVESGADGRPLKRSYLAADGSLQKIELYSYAGGSAAGGAGEPGALETRRADGSLASRTTYSYGALGELVSSRTEDGAGAARESRRYEYSIREDTKTETYYE